MRLRINRGGSWVLGVAVVAGNLGGCGASPGVESVAELDLLHTQAQASLADFKGADSSLEALLANAYGYAVFPRVVVAAAVVGGGHGDGEVYQGTELIGYADVSAGSVGAQLGGQRYAELVVFENEGPMADFKAGTLEFDGRATAVAASKGTGAAADYRRGVLVFTLTQSGLMAQAAIGGQKFRYRAK